MTVGLSFSTLTPGINKVVILEVVESDEDEVLVELFVLVEELDDEDEDVETEEELLLEDVECEELDDEDEILELEELEEVE